jgi:hypothetical protein
VATGASLFLNSYQAGQAAMTIADEPLTLNGGGYNGRQRRARVLGHEHLGRAGDPGFRYGHSGGAPPLTISAFLTRLADRAV